MASALLDIRDLRELDALYLDTMRRIDEIRSRPLGTHIQRPKLPASLTEGLAALASPVLFGAPACRPAWGRSDLAIRGFDGDERLVAVKGTAAARWITVTQTDLAAGALIWVDYTDRAADGVSPVQLRLFDKRVGTWASAGRATLSQLMGSYDGELREAKIRFSSVTTAEGKSILVEALDRADTGPIWQRLDVDQVSGIQCSHGLLRESSRWSIHRRDDRHQSEG